MFRQPRHPLDSRSERGHGYTLLEVLVATGIMVLLGGGLVSLLSQAINMWHGAEKSAYVYDQARVILDSLAADLRSTVTMSESASDASRIRFICDVDGRKRQRLRFVRTISAEMGDPILREGGRFLRVNTPAAYDGRNDALEAEEGQLGAPGGVMEIFYALDPRADHRLLWRGVRTPIGGSLSLFRNRNIDGTTEASKLIGKKKAKDDKPDLYDGVPFRKLARPLTDGVLFLGFSFWGPTTNTWDPLALPLSKPGAKDRSGPLFHWDSTRALFDDKANSVEFAFRRRPLSLGDASDDIFPEMVEITLVLRMSDSLLGAMLSSELSSKASTFRVSQPLSLPSDVRGHFLLVGGEWIAVGSLSGRVVTVAKAGRGVRGTAAKAHPAGTRVQLGVTFRRVVEIPGYRGHKDEFLGESRSVRGFKSRRGRR